MLAKGGLTGIAFAAGRLYGHVGTVLFLAALYLFVCQLISNSNNNEQYCKTGCSNERSVSVVQLVKSSTQASVSWYTLFNLWLVSRS